MNFKNVFKGLRRLKSSGKQHRQADEYWSMAETFEKQGRYPEAVQFYKKSVEAEKTAPTPRMENLYKALESVGYCYYSMIGEYNESLLLIQSIVLCRS